MSRICINYQPLPNGKFPDLRNIPIKEWATVQSSINSGIIEIDALKETKYRECAGEITWRQYFGWLAGLSEEEAKIISWNDLKNVVATHLAGVFGLQTPSQSPTESLAKPGENISAKAVSKIAQPYNDTKNKDCHTPKVHQSNTQEKFSDRNRYRDVCKMCVPERYLPPSLTKKEQYQDIFIIEDD